MCNLSRFYLKVLADQTHFFDEVDTLDDVYIVKDVDNEFQVK